VPLSIGITGFGLVSLCMLFDVRTRRIPNLLSAAGMVAGAALNVVFFGLSGLYASMEGLAVMLGVLLLPFALGGIGGGDVKMMGALGALLGPLPALAALVSGTILGGAVMVIHLARLGRLREKLRATRMLFMSAVSTQSLAPLKLSATDANAVSLPYSVPLGLGAIAVIVLSRVLGGW
jgi:prepilin peptidase CpaA